MIGWRRSAPGSAVVLGLIVSASGAGVLGSVALAAGGKVTICHRTHSTTNPYRRISVSISSVNGSSGNDHSHHAGPVFDPSYAYPPNQKIWGDVIPDNAAGGAGNGLNWQGNAAGQAMYASSYCKGMTAQAYYNSEREAGVPREEILADLAEQRADEDAGTTFTGMTYTGSDTSLPDYGGTPASASPSPSAESPSPEPSESASPETSESPSPDPSDSPEPSESPSPDPSESAEPSSSPEPSDSPEPPEPSDSPEPSESVEPSASPDSSASPDPSTSPEPEPEPDTSSSPSPATEPVPSVAPPPAPARQRIDALVWLDLDRDGTRDPREPGIPSIDVTLTPLALPSLGRDASTDSAGAVGFGTLPPGTYRVRAGVPSSLHVTRDSDGASDAVADVLLPAGADGDAWVGLAGDSALRATVLGPSGQPVDGPVSVRWAGPDGIPGTADDVVVEAVAVDGVVRISGLPAGTYVLSSGGANTPATLKEGETAAVVLGTRTVAEPAPRGASLPNTGGPVGGAVPAALACLFAGAASVRAASRRAARRG